MAKLTSERVNGIKTGYWSPYTKEVICQRLGQIEHRYEQLIGQICDGFCKWPRELPDKTELNRKCEECPLTFLDRMISGEYPAEL